MVPHLKLVLRRVIVAPLQNEALAVKEVLDRWGFLANPANDNLYPLLKATQSSLLGALTVILLCWPLTHLSNDHTASSDIGLISFAIFCGAFIFFLFWTNFVFNFYRVAKMGALPLLDSTRALYEGGNIRRTFTLGCNQADAFDRTLFAMSKMQGLHICAVDLFAGTISGLSGADQRVSIVIRESSAEASDIEVTGGGLVPILIECAVKKQVTGLLDNSFRLKPKLPSILKRQKICINILGAIIGLTVLVMPANPTHDLTQAESLYEHGMHTEALAEANIAVESILDSHSPMLADYLERRGVLKMNVAADRLFSAHVSRAPIKTDDLKMLDSALKDFAQANQIAGSENVKSYKAQILAWKGDDKAAREALKEVSELEDPSIELNTIKNITEGKLEVAYINLAEHPFDTSYRRTLERKKQLLTQLSKTNPDYKPSLEAVGEEMSIRFQLTNATRNQTEPEDAPNLPLTSFGAACALAVVTYQLKERKAEKKRMIPEVHDIAQQKLPNDLSESLVLDDSWWNIQEETISTAPAETLIYS